MTSTKPVCGPQCEMSLTHLNKRKTCFSSFLLHGGSLTTLGFRLKGLGQHVHPRGQQWCLQAGKLELELLFFFFSPISVCSSWKSMCDFEANAAVSPALLTSVSASWLVQPFGGDGWCDTINNRAYCQYDKGDCCPSTLSTRKVQPHAAPPPSATFPPAGLVVYWPQFSHFSVFYQLDHFLLFSHSFSSFDEEELDVIWRPSRRPDRA